MGVGWFGWGEGSALFAQASPEARQRTIWVVDDEAQVCRLLRALLSRGGFHVETFESATSALEVLREQQPQIDLLITDQTMPGLLGTELAEAARTLNADLTVFLCTGYADRADQLEGNPAIAKVFAKPLDLPAFRRAVDEALNPAT